MDVYTIYFNARDFPGEFSARRHSIIDGGPTPDHWHGLTLEGARAWVREFSIRRGMMADAHFVRSPRDEPHIVESWL